jgi:tellurite resistance protein TehA-like permease
MNLLKLIQFLRDRLKTVIWISCAVLALLALADIFLVSNEEAHTPAEHIPAFWSIFGFFACVLIIILSKWFGHLGIMTREDYYEDKPSAAQEEPHE